MYHLEDIVFQLVHADLVVETLVGILISKLALHDVLMSISMTFYV
jgi:hypothetical protein